MVLAAEAVRDTESGVVYAKKVRLDRRARQIITRGWCWCFGHDWTDPTVDEDMITERCLNRCGGLRLTRILGEPEPEWPSDHVRAMHDLAYSLGEVRHWDAAIERGLDASGRAEAYMARRQMLAAAIGQAHRCGFEWGFRIDLKEPEWPVLYIELPTGQCSWHMPQHSEPWDGHSTELKMKRIDAFLRRLGEGGYDELAREMF